MKQLLSSMVITCALFWLSMWASAQISQEALRTVQALVYVIVLVAVSGLIAEWLTKK